MQGQVQGIVASQHGDQRLHVQDFACTATVTLAVVWHKRRQTHSLWCPTSDWVV